MITVSEWITALSHIGVDLKRSGVEWVGPCPVCGGQDRFHIKESAGRAIIGCRGCIDERPPDSKRQAYELIRQITFGDKKPVTRTLTSHHTTNELRREKAMSQFAAQTAAQMIKDARPRRHPYLARKGFPNKQKLVINDLLIIPIYTAGGKLVSAQTIRADGEKHFLKGGKITNNFHLLGPLRAKCVLVEGLATGLSILAALKILRPGNGSVKVCFSAANIAAVARERDVIIADHDLHGTGEKWAQRTNCKWWMPSDLGDANDMHLQKGLTYLIDELRNWKELTK